MHARVSKLHLTAALSKKLLLLPLLSAGPSCMMTWGPTAISHLSVSIKALLNCSPCHLQQIPAAGIPCLYDPALSSRDCCRGLLDMYLSSGDAALLEASLQRLGTREREVQQEIQVVQKLQGSFTGGPGSSLPEMSGSL